MPLSTVCVSTVTRPRAWSSYTNIRAKDEVVYFSSIMNSAQEISKYKAPNDKHLSPTLNRRYLSCGYDFPEKSPKKEKKWSLGSFFRRKKKDESTSSDDEKKTGFLGRKKRKPDKKKKCLNVSKPVHAFDHVVISRNSHLYSNGFLDQLDHGILSDPTHHIQRSEENLRRPIKNSEESLEAGSMDTLRRKPRGLAKERAEARRGTLRSSSEEESAESGRFRSDESLGAPQSRRSRAARTERYLKRHSRDGEAPNNYLRVSKSDVEHWNYARQSDESNRSMSRSPLVPKTALSHSGLSTIPPSHTNHARIRVSNSTSNPSYKPPQSMNEYNNSTNQPKSISCEANIYKTNSSDIMHIQFPIARPYEQRYRNLSLIDTRHFNSALGRQPPPPPPRDPRRLTENEFVAARPSTYYFDTNRSKSLNSSALQNRLYSGVRSTSEDHLPKTTTVQLGERPSSATPDAKMRIVQKSDTKINPENFNYLTDKKPRSRKPIFIQPGTNVKPEQNCETNNTKMVRQFWKQKENETRVKSPQIFTCQTSVQTQVFLPSVLQQDNAQEQNSLDAIDGSIEEYKQKSTNLEEALDELEAIYKSLRLGDDDLLERAEQREKDMEIERARKHKADKYLAKGALSDSGFCYEPFESVESPRRRRLGKKSQTVDRKADDMAFRKWHKQRAATINDPQAALAKVSYLIASPLYNGNEEAEKDSNEPSITLDDVVYRNIKYANHVQKIVEPQPPFGIPLGPIALGANSDYLHAVPECVPRPTFKPRKIPDLVKDDLAYRNLRKDPNKEPALPSVSPEDFKNNNMLHEQKFAPVSIKKKRAVRSLSANIGSLINKDVLAKGLERYKENNNEFNDLENIADAMEIARQVLRERETKISARASGFLSDTETKPDLKESRMNFLNSLKDSHKKTESNYYNYKPPTPDRKSPRKESTPIPLSPMEERKLIEERNSSLDELLSALASETRATSERISNELKQFDEHDENLNRKLDAIDSVSEQAKLCEKMLEGVELMEEVGQIDVEPVLAETLANVVLSRSEDATKSGTKVEETVIESDHDYENLKSDDELNLNVIDQIMEKEKCTSPFEEHKAELIASFQELKKNVDNIDTSTKRIVDEGKQHSPVRSRSRLPRWLRPQSTASENNSDSAPLAMSEQEALGSGERIALYKEQRRCELAAQFQDKVSISPSGHYRRRLNNNNNSKDQNSSSSDGGGGGPRATRTSRMRAAAAQESLSSPRTRTPIEKSASPIGSCRVERDKSSKRKSNLNRSLNVEEVSGANLDDAKTRRRRRRFFPPDVLGQFAHSPESDPLTLSATPPPSSPASLSPRLTTPRRSQLSVHMENARKSLTPSYCEMGKPKPPAATRRSPVPSPRPDPDSHSDRDASYNKENRRRSHPKSGVRPKSGSDQEGTGGCSVISKKLEDVRQLTLQTLANVERLAKQNKSRLSELRKMTPKATQLASILKKSSLDEPVSILKRKDDKCEPAHTSPVTFSPSVVEPATTNRKQGILKKRRSLDESQVMRHRSCSPDAAGKADSRSILKGQRRSSLEELRLDAGEPQLHGILKRKTSRSEEDDQSLNSPQSILKRRSGASSAGSVASSPHVSITTAVILAAARGAEIILESETYRPILKKKSFSGEEGGLDAASDTPKPILKKKSSTDTEEGEERPKRPILKVSAARDFDGDMEGGEGGMRPILKNERPRLSFSSDNCEEGVRMRTSRRSHTICADFGVGGLVVEDRGTRKERPLSVSDLVMSFEEAAPSTGAIPKRNSLSKRQSDRYRTQPITSNELEESLSFVRSPQLDENISILSKSSPLYSPNANQSVNSLLDFTSSLENDSHLNSFLNFIPSTDSSGGSAGGVCSKMSSDSAFQSLGDGLELDQDDEKSIELPSTLKTNTNRIDAKALAEEAKKMRLGKGLQKLHKTGTGDRSTSSRFSTQPVTFEEVQEASKLKEASVVEEDESDPANLSLSERIKLFSSKLNNTNDLQKRVPTPRRRLNRFQTQPVTSSEVDTARYINPTLLDGGERRSILKTDLQSPIAQRKSVLKKRDSFNFKVENADVTYDEGISCNDSASDSETVTSDYKKAHNRLGKSNSDTTSDGESSGGREIQSIFKNDNKLRVKAALESVLSKSKSQSKVGNDSIKKIVTIRRSQTQSAMPRSIAEIQAELQQNGESGWKKRIQQNHKVDDLKLLKDKNRYNDELSEKSNLASVKDDLDAASEHWRSRVEKSDAEKYSVAGRMDKKNSDLTINIPTPTDKNKVKPQAKRFKGKEDRNTVSTPGSPDKQRHENLSRSYSTPDPDQDSSGSDSSLRASGRKVPIPRPDDFTFTNFYKKTTTSDTASDVGSISLDDFDAITRQSMLVQKKNVQVQKKRIASKNPIKALASRQDIANEYTEITTGVAERELRRLNVEKLAKGSHLAVEAIAALTTKEDFSSISLKKSSFVPKMAPFTDPMLLHVKGRRHIQTRLVEPTASSINEGDNFLLITPKTIYNYSGAYANVIEQSRTSDILNYIVQKNDLGTTSAEIVSIDAKSPPTRKTRTFWSLLDCNDLTEVEITKAGHPNEDEIYESNILSTNMIYRLDGDELVPYDEYWGVLPKIEMLKEDKVIVFDFGSEMYVWSGKTAPSEQKALGLKLAKQLWDEGYSYSLCNVCPLNVASILGDRDASEVKLEASKRPDWALFCKITQHRETILFREKFVDWPDHTRLIRVKSNSSERIVDASYNIQPCNVDKMLNDKQPEPDFIVEGHHLGRGTNYFDEETNRLFEFETLDISVWRILDSNSEKLVNASIGHFYDGDSYIVRWNYKMTVRGRELGGKPSKYVQAGRDRCVYFCWQGANASINEKGYAALLTVELDSENAPQVRVAQGYEPAAFLSLFNGKMVIHAGKRDDECLKTHKLYMIRGEMELERHLLEVPCKMEQLRSRTSFVLVDGDAKRVILWHGAKSNRKNKRAIRCCVRAIVGDEFADFKWNEEDGGLVEVAEGGESREFFKIMGRERDAYVSLVDEAMEFDYTMRLFALSSILSAFEASEVLCQHRSEFSSPYPFLQSDLYSASQPALFLIDNHHELWLWQGWWPERDEAVELSDQTGSGAVRWQAERRAAMQTALDYWHRRHGAPPPAAAPIRLVWAGLEPPAFRCLFPTWRVDADVAALNALEGRVADGMPSVRAALAQLSRTVYPLEELLRRPLPEGVDPTHLEVYLSNEEFAELLAMSKEEFGQLPSWKKTALKKEKGLF